LGHKVLQVPYFVPRQALQDPLGQKVLLDFSPFCDSKDHLANWLVLLLSDSWTVSLRFMRLLTGYFLEEIFERAVGLIAKTAFASIVVWFQIVVSSYGNE